MIHDIDGGITAPKGFLASGLHCGVKKVKKDIALLYSEVPAVTSAVFTKNKVIAAPLVADKEQLARSTSIRALIVNSGNANACTGDRGLKDAWDMIRATANALNVGEHEVLVSSTGVIGQFMPMEKILEGIRAVAGALAQDGHENAAEAIRTTDTFTKEAAMECNVNGTRVRIGGMAKGSGMIAPNMATMLAFITTDAAISQPLLQNATALATYRSFNRISVDGDMSTNDMVTVFASGLAGNVLLANESDPGYGEFYAALENVLVRLSKMIVMDGEGATKFVEIQLVGAASEDEAATAARAVANSNLVKTAINGEDANWGRILAAIGYSGISFEPGDVEIWFGNVPILRRNYHIDFSEEEAKKVLVQREIVIRIDLHRGSSQAFFWTCDLSKEYVAINANYRT
jgi:glutamate N-acetyltransferase / amino-acid N-acetyltransferase